MKSHLVHCPKCDRAFMIDEPLSLNSNNSLRNECVHCGESFVARYSAGRIFTLALDPSNEVCDIVRITHDGNMKYVKISPIYKEVFPSGITPLVNSYMLKFDFDLALIPENLAILKTK